MKVIVTVGVVVLIGVPTQQVVREYRASDIIRVRRYEDHDDDDLKGVMDIGGREGGHSPIQFRLLFCYVPLPVCKGGKRDGSTV
jgi:hypothetical protein